MKKLLALALAAVMALGCGAALADTLIQGIDPEYPPFSYLGDDGEYTGFDVEICKGGLRGCRPGISGFPGGLG